MVPTVLHCRGAVLPDAVVPPSPRGAARITCADGRIIGIDADASATIGIDAMALPGFIDLQVNGGGGRDVAETSDEALDAVATASWQGGAVAFLPTLITAPFADLLQQLARVADWIDRWRGQGAEPLGIHLEGPFLEVAGAHDESAFVDPTPDRVAALLEAARGRLAMLTLAPSRPGAPQAVAQLRAAGVCVALGHARSSAQMAACVDAGANLVTHLFNAMGPLHHREPGVAGFALDEPRLTCSLICDGLHVHPTMVRNAFAILGPDRTLLVTDAAAPAGRPDGVYRLGREEVVARGGEVRRADGALAGSALTMDTAAQRFATYLGPRCGPWTLARVGSTNAARLLGRDDFGQLIPGRRACLTLLRPDGTLAAWRA
ncbi:MAG: N-acetylglucosamine-6-phosphate deacetylase [Planctomycetota bacterium]